MQWQRRKAQQIYEEVSLLLRHNNSFFLTRYFTDKHLMCKNLNSSVYRQLSVFLVNFARIFPTKLETDMLHYMGNTLRHTLFLDNCSCVFKIHSHALKKYKLRKNLMCYQQQIFAHVFYNIPFSYLTFLNYFLQQTCAVFFNFFDGESLFLTVMSSNLKRPWCCYYETLTRSS